MTKKWYTLLIAAFLAACTGSSPTSPTLPAPEPVAVQAPTPQVAVAPTVVEEETSSTDTVYFERTHGSGCAGTLVNPTPNAKNVVVHYTPPAVPAGEQDYFTLNFEVPGNGQLVTPSAQDAFENNYTKPEPSCEPWKFEAEVQCDYRGLKGGHIAGRFDSASLSQDALPVIPLGEPTSETKWGPWSDIIEGENGCYRERKGTTITTQPYQCAEPKVTEEPAYERQEVPCPCVDMNVWTLKNVSRRTHTFMITTHWFTPWNDVVEGPFTLAPGETVEFTGYPNTTLYVFQHDHPLQWRYEHKKTSGSCEVRAADVEGSCTGKLYVRCECVPQD